ncbi:heavy-metal-associated domain-containing protein [Noviherbaspirillum sp.]|uniref:heavy-metal-associated domain-containing protein n=1 Tax=Noviherbaspirillum sp. TaxID=1926288 RepID=UPI002FE2F51D
MYELQVEGMNCGGCVKGVTRSVHTVDSNAKVDVDLKARTVRVDTNAGLDAIASAITKAGYPVINSTPR